MLLAILPLRKYQISGVGGKVCSTSYENIVWNELHGTFVRPYWSLKGPLVILGIFRVGRCFVVILLQFQIFGTDFGLQKLNWDNFVMAHTNFVQIFSGFQWKFTVLFNRENPGKSGKFEIWRNLVKQKIEIQILGLNINNIILLGAL